MSTLPALTRWRLVLGDAAEALGELGPEGQAMDAALQWLYGRDPELAQRDERGASDDASPMSVPEWIGEIQRLFPHETIERLERDAVQRYRLHEVLTSPEVLARVEPSLALLEAVLQTKHLMRPDVLAMARELVRKVVQELMEKLAREVRRAFSGTLDRRRRSPLRIARNLDFRKTLHDNLRRWDPKTKRLLLEKTFFFARTRRHVEKWQVILLVDQSGSMTSSVIHSAVTASCLWSLPGLKTHLVAFDTSVVDLTSDVTDPVELLMKVQLGGGTDIGKAVAYASGLIDAPRRAIVVIITDFYEGGDPALLVRYVTSLCAQGTSVLGLAAIGDQPSVASRGSTVADIAVPNFDRELAQRLVDVGAHVAAMTPGQLANWIAEKVGR